MNPEIYQLGEAAVFSGIAAFGFGAMFNVSWKNLGVCFVIAGLAGIVKYFTLEIGVSLGPASFLGALTAGILATVVSKKSGYPPIIFSIPAVIPMVPGVLGFKTILGALAILQQGVETSPEIVAQTVSFALSTVFIAIALAIGVSLPSLTQKNQIDK